MIVATFIITLMINLLVLNNKARDQNKTTQSHQMVHKPKKHNTTQHNIDY